MNVLVGKLISYVRTINNRLRAFFGLKRLDCLIHVSSPDSQPYHLVNCLRFELCPFS